MDPIRALRPCRRPAHPPRGVEGYRRCGSVGNRAADRVGADHRAADLPRLPLHARRRLGRPAADGVVLWTRLAPEPLNGGGMPMANVEVQLGGRRRSRSSRRSRRRARRSPGPSSGTACTSR